MKVQYKEEMCYYYAVAKKTDGDVTEGTYTVGRNRNANAFAPNEFKHSCSSNMTYS
jgi:hypothetical protein